MREKELKIEYHGELNEELDQAIEECLARFGYKRWASGYDLVAEVRDLAFDLEQEEA